jgi:hypothetical protein
MLEDERDVFNTQRNGRTKHYQEEESCQGLHATRPVRATEDHWLDTITPERLERNRD